jgi:hypothetical protein
MAKREAENVVHYHLLKVVDGWEGSYEVLHAHPVTDPGHTHEVEPLGAAYVWEEGRI